MASFGEAAKKQDEKPSGEFEILGGTLLVEVAVAPSHLDMLYQQVRDAARRGMLDGYADAAEEIARVEQADASTGGVVP